MGTGHSSAWAEKLDVLVPTVQEIREAWERWMEALYQLLAANAAADETGNLTLRLKPNDLPESWDSLSVDGNNVIQLLSDLIRPLEKLTAEIREEADELSLQGMLTDLSGVVKDLANVRADTQSFVTLGKPEFVYWVEGHSQYRGDRFGFMECPLTLANFSGKACSSAKPASL